MDVLRTPDDRFADLPGYPFEPHYAEIPDGDGRHAARAPRRRGHPTDAGRAAAARRAVVVLPLPAHDPGARRRRAPRGRARPRRLRAVRQAGRSATTTPTSATSTGCASHVFDELDLRDITLVGQDWGGLLGLRLVAEQPDRFAGVVAANTFLPTGDGRPGEAFLAWQKFSQEVPELPSAASSTAAAPPTSPPRSSRPTTRRSPTRRYKEGRASSRSLVPTTPDDPAAPANRGAWEVLGAFDKPFLCAFSDQDPITAGDERLLISRIAGRAGPAAHHDRGRRALPPGGPRTRAGPGRHRPHR